MKKLFFISLISITASLKTNAQVKFGVTSGIAISNYGLHEDFKKDAQEFNISVAGKSQVSFTGGLLAEIKAGKHFSIQPALNYVRYCAKHTLSAEDEEGYVTIKAAVNSIELPVNLLYTTQQKNIRFFIGAGPCITYHSSGKAYSDFSQPGEDDSEDEIKFGSSDDKDMKQWNIGANVVAGMEVGKGFFFSLNYNAGLTSLQPANTEQKIYSKSHYFGIRVGYFLK